MIKTLNKIGLEGNYLNKTKAIYEKPTGSIILSSERLQVSSKMRNKQESAFTTSIQHSTGSSSQNNWERKGIQTEKE